MTSGVKGYVISTLCNLRFDDGSEKLELHYRSVNLFANSL